MATIIVPISLHINERIKRRWNMDNVARNYRLYFSRQEVLGNKMIGLDRWRRKLVVLAHKKYKACCHIIDLKELTSCSIKKIYKSIEAGDLKKRKLDEYLHTLSLHLGFNDGRTTFILPFYEAGLHSVTNISELEAKARDWMSMLLKMLPLSIKERA